MLQPDELSIIGSTLNPSAHVASLRGGAGGEECGVEVHRAVSEMTKPEITTALFIPSKVRTKSKARPKIPSRRYLLIQRIIVIVEVT